VTTMTLVAWDGGRSTTPLSAVLTQQLAAHACRQTCAAPVLTLPLYAFLAYLRVPAGSAMAGTGSSVLAATILRVSACNRRRGSAYPLLPLSLAKNHQHKHAPYRASMVAARHAQRRSLGGGLWRR